MSISHWGIFPGFYESEYVQGYPIGSTSRAVYRPVDWRYFCQAMDGALG